MKRRLLITSILCISTSITPMINRARTLTRPYKPAFMQNKPLSVQIEPLDKPLDARKCNNVIMILDPLQLEYTGKITFMTGTACLTSLTAALIEQTAPILTTKNILHYACADMIANGKYRESIPSTFTNNNWYCIAHKNADLVLLIPKNYIAAKVCSFPLVDQITSCGFNCNIADFDIIEKLFPTELINSINMTTNYSVDIIDAIKNLFSITHQNDNNSPSWNMYIAGHGIPSYTKKTLDENLEENLKASDELKYIRLSLEKNNYEKKEIEQTKRLLQEAESHTDDTIIPNSGHTAGLMTNDFLDLLSFFNKNLKISFLHYTSCFSTGSNLAIIADSLAKLNVNFIISCQGTTEEATTVSNFTKASSTTPFTRFFSALCNMFNNSSQSIFNHPGHDPIKTIISTIVRPEEHALVRIPSVGIFSAISVDKRVKLLTDPVIKIHEFENKFIDCSTPDMEAIIVYSSYIGVPLKMNNFCHIHLALPQNFESLSKRKIYVFEEMNRPDTIDSLALNLRDSNKTYTPITLVIKKLNCLNLEKQPSSITNMVFAIKGTRLSSQGPFSSKIISLFSDKNNTYTADLARRNPSILPIKNVSPELISEVIDVHNMENIDLDNVTLPILVEQLEKKTSKEFAVQSPGSLQKILEQKLVESINLKSPGAVEMVEESDPKIARIVEESKRQHAEQIRHAATRKAFESKPSVKQMERE